MTERRRRALGPISCHNRATTSSGWPVPAAGKPGRRRSRGRQPLGPASLALLLLGPLLLLASGCEPARPRASWRIYPLPRQHPHDGLAVVNQPDGYGLHIWVDSDTSEEGSCRPRWNPDAARLFNGNGSAPFSSGLATRAEFYAAMGRGPVRLALRREIEALCRDRSPRSTFIWTEPPRRAAEFRPPPLASLEERHLLSDPEAIKRAELRLLGVPPGERGSSEAEPNGPSRSGGPTRPQPR